MGRLVEIRHIFKDLAAMPCQQLERELENLSGTGYDNYPISPQTPALPRGYNCIAFAAGETHRPWWPHLFNRLYFWPPDLSREYPGRETVENFIQAFEWKGYKKCKNGIHRNGIEKVAIFLKNNRPK